MTAEGHKVASLHGAKDAAERDAIIDGFRAGRDKVCPSLSNYDPSFTPFRSSDDPPVDSCLGQPYYYQY